MKKVFYYCFIMFFAMFLISCDNQEKHIISFNSMGGSEISNIKQVYNSEIEELPIPTKSGFVFAGWYFDEDFTDYLNYKKMPDYSFTVYAKWMSLEYINYNSFDGEISIYSYTGTEKHIFLPKIIDGLPVTTINSFINSSITSIFIPSTVKEIGDSAFRLSYMVSNPLETITFEENSQLRIIGKEAFAGTAITNIIIPSSVEEIREYAFSYSNSLETITFEENSQLRIIGSHAFEGTAIKTITIPSSVEEIMNLVFNDANSLENIEVQSENEYYESNNGILYTKDLLVLKKYPEGKSDINYEISANVEEIGDFAFRASDKLSNSLETITFEEGSHLRVIGSYAFENTSITNIVIPSGVEEIRDSAFVDLYSLETITFGDNSQLKIIGSSAFENTSITSINIPASVEEIRDSAFNDIDTLETITFERNSHLKIIGRRAFYGSSITSIVIPSSVEEIRDYAFNYINLLEIITFEENSQLKIIGEGAFAGIAITSIVIPASVEEIRSSAFSDINTLETITFEEGSQLNIIGAWVFDSTSITSIIIPASVEEIGEYAFYGIRTLSIIYAEASEKPDGWSYSWNPENIPVEWGYLE